MAGAAAQPRPPLLHLLHALDRARLALRTGRDDARRLHVAGGHRLRAAHEGSAPRGEAAAGGGVAGVAGAVRGAADRAQPAAAAGLPPRRPGARRRAQASLCVRRAQAPGAVALRAARARRGAAAQRGAQLAGAAAGALRAVRALQGAGVVAHLPAQPPRGARRRDARAPAPLARAARDDAHAPLVAGGAQHVPAPHRLPRAARPGAYERPAGRARGGGAARARVRLPRRAGQVAERTGGGAGGTRRCAGGEGRSVQAARRQLPLRPRRASAVGGGGEPLARLPRGPRDAPPRHRRALGGRGSGHRRRHGRRLVSKCAMTRWAVGSGIRSPTPGPIK
mmetsp:Transcript_13156/g.33414  ORF Transcript_13156/g.33414 Transcript_13156/m.33414 type:complete len:337 (-) Transcript_13156:306-1316(-)